MSQKFPAYKVTCADIERLKIVAASVFDRSVSPQTRLEIIARSAGFGSYAALRASLDEGSVFLSGDQSREESHIRKSGVDPAKVPFIEGVSLNTIIAAGLALPEAENVVEVMGMSPRDRLALLKACRPSLSEILDFLYSKGLAYRGTGVLWRSSLSHDDLRRARREDAVLMVSPRNRAELGYDFELERSVLSPSGDWTAVRVHLPETVRFFDTPDEAQMVRPPWDDKDALARLVEGARIIVFDEIDAQEVRSALSAAGLKGWDRVNVQPIKAQALDIENEDDGDFFTIGYYGTARNDLEADIREWSEERLAPFAMNWFCELVNVVHGCAYEFSRITFGGEPVTPRIDLKIEL